MSTDDFVSRVEQFMRRKCHIREDAHVLVGLSGGPDSVALADVLRHVQSEVSAVHVNHCMRGSESDADEDFVCELADQWGMPLYVSRLSDSPSSEEEARDARLGILQEYRRLLDAEVVALGHHRDDQAETVLQNLLRGSGTAGLRGILPRRGIFAHPMLERSREEVLAYLASRGIDYRVDSSNLRPDFQRNRVRLELIPYLREHFNPEVNRALAQLAEILRGDEEFLARETGRLFRSHARVTRDECGHLRRITLPRDEFLRFPLAMQRRLLRLAIRVLAKTTENLSYLNVWESLQFIRSHSGGGGLQLPGGLLLASEYGTIYVSGEVYVEQDACPSAVLPVPGHLLLPGKGRVVARVLTGNRAKSVRQCLIGGNPPSLVSHAFIDYNKVDLPIWMRAWNFGDSMEPLGMRGEKKLQDLFVDEKIPRRRRHEVPVILSGSRIAWVVGVRLSEEYRVDCETERILHLWFDDTWPRS